MNNLHADSNVLLAHDLQLQRAYWDFLKVKNSRADSRKLAIIVPDIADTPYVRHPAPGQWHTGGELRYKLVELFLARPRDYWTAVPRQMNIPLDAGRKLLLPR
jgi:hypothetical protein